jgi:4-hydroxyphenylpyruvate dioxygenase-like putative hemolysin
MAIVRLQHIGLAVHDLKAACDRFETVFGLKARDYRNDQGKGMQLDARILLGNDCWLHVVQNWNPEARVNQWLRSRGEGLEHIALETDDIEADVAHLRDQGVPIYMDKIFNAPDGFEAFVYPDQTPGLTIELIQPHKTSWGYPPEAERGPVSDRMGIFRLQHVGLGVRDLNQACERFEQLFGLKARDYRNDQGQGMQLDSRILCGNECWLHLVQNWNPQSRVYKFVAASGEGLEHIALQTTTIESDVAYLREQGIPIYMDKIFNANDGFEAFVYPDQTPGLTVELIQPHATSWGYPTDERIPARQGE